MTVQHRKDTWGKHSITVVVKIYPHWSSILDKSLLKYALNSPPEKAKVNSSLRCGQCMKVYILFIAVLDIAFQSFWWLWNHGLWISDFSRSRAIFFIETHYDLDSYDIFSPQVVTLCAFPYSLAVFSQDYFCQKKKKFNAILSPNFFS